MNTSRIERAAAVSHNLLAYTGHMWKAGSNIKNADILAVTSIKKRTRRNVIPEWLQLHSPSNSLPLPFKAGGCKASSRQGGSVGLICETLEKHTIAEHMSTSSGYCKNT